MTGGNIKSAVFRAACRAALRPAKERKLTMQVAGGDALLRMLDMVTSLVPRLYWAVQPGNELYAILA